MLRLLFAAMLPLVLAQRPPHPYNKWRSLEQQLKGWSFTENFAVNVGNATHTLFTYESESFNMHEVVQTQSTSKWPMAMMLTGLVADGTIRSLDSRPNEYISWWTRDPEDPRSNVTLRNLLSFTSGFGSGDPGSEGGNRTCMDEPFGWTFEDCAKNIYLTTQIDKRIQDGYARPGEVFAYNSNHLQLAGAMAVAASKLPIELLVEKYFIHAYGMNETRCAIPSRSNPQLAICLETTGYDYSKFLRAQLRREKPSRRMVLESERDYTPFMAEKYQLYGVYGFGHWLECFDSYEGYTQKCETDNVHADPGGLGWYPLIDRSNDYYMQIVAAESGKFYARSGIPEYLRLLVKPLVEATMADEKELYEKLSTRFPRFEALTLSDINYIGGCFTDPESCSSVKGGLAGRRQRHFQEQQQQQQQQQQ